MTTLSRLVSSPEAQQVGQGLVIATVVLTMMLSAGAIALVQLRAAGLIAQAFGGAHGQMGSFASALRAFDAVVRPRRLPVWPLPTAWRDVATRGLGAPAVFTRWLTLPMLAFACFTLCLGGVTRTRGLPWMVGVTFGLLTLLITLVVSVSSFSSERQQRTLPLMLTTTHHTAWLVLGKVLGVMSTTGAWAGTTLVLMSVGSMQSPYSLYFHRYGIEPMTCTFPEITRYSALVDALELVAWGGSTWWLLIAASMVVAMRARPARVAFPVLIGTLVTVPTGAALLDRGLFSALFPVVSTRGWSGCSGNWITVGVTIGQFLLGLLLLGVLMLRARAWILADARAS